MQEVLDLLLKASHIADRASKGQTGPEVEEAVSLFRLAIEKNPEVLDAYSRLSRLLSKMGRHREAIEALEAAVAIWPTSKNLRLRVAVAHGEQRNFEKVDFYSRSVYDEQPNSERALEILMSSLFYRKRSDEAVALAEEFLDRQPDNAVISGLLGMHLFADFAFETEEESRKIQRYLHQGLNSRFPRRGIRHALALMAHAAGKMEDVIELAGREVSDYPSATRTRQLLLRSLAQEKRYADQLPHWEDLRSRDPQNVDLVYSHAQALWNSGKQKEAAAQVQAGLALNPEHARLWMLQANVLDQAGDNEAAQAAYQKALSYRQAELKK
jgi:tetratricopeptide (TPR) repeat protein